MSDPRVRHWPEHAVPPVEHRVETDCPLCGVHWLIHTDLAGYRLRCACGTWIAVPPLPEEKPLALEVEPEGLPLAPAHTWPRDEGGLVVLPGEGEQAASNREIPTSLPMGPGTLRHATVRTKQRWHNRGILELVGMMAAFLVPYLLVQISLTGPQQALWLPLAGLASGLLVLLIGLGSVRYTFGLVCAPKARFLVESTLAALGLAFLALAYQQLLVDSGMPDEGLGLDGIRNQVGLGLTLFLIAFCPGIFEELAFRGLLQGRLTALMGTTLGVLVSGTAFALAHGITLGFPFHVAIGLYLGWLRNRAGSLVPGMWMHALYNGTLVLMV